MEKEILEAIKEKGLLLEKEIFDLLREIGDVSVARDLLETFEKTSKGKMITKNVLNKNFEYVRGVVGKLPGEEKNYLEKVFVKMGLSLEVRREQVVAETKKDVEQLPKQNYQVFYAATSPDKKLEVKDFTGHFRARYQHLQRILMQRPDVQSNLVSIGKISSDRASLSIIGIVVEKRITKNKNLIIKFEDLTGQVGALVKHGSEIFERGEELQLDDVVAVKASGSRELLFVHNIFYPDAFKLEKTKFEEEICVAFLSDVHAGSKGHLGREFERFLKWLNSEDELAQKISYLFFTGDNVDGVGIFPGQEDSLDLKSMGEQYSLLASYLRNVPKRITMFMCPGQHDATRVAEPQPLISKRYASALYDIENLVLVTNPCLVKLLERSKEFKILMYHGASLHTLINEIKELRDLKAHTCPAKAGKHLLKRRHLAPTHSEVVYIPNANLDPLVIDEVPDVLATGEIHRPDVENYNGVLIIAGSCWQSQTAFEEKVGNIPDPCKVPILNLKTRELRVLDFSQGEE